MANMGSTEQLNSAINELDDMYQDLKTLHRKRSMKESETDNTRDFPATDFNNAEPDGTIMNPSFHDVEFPQETFETYESRGGFDQYYPPPEHRATLPITPRHSYYDNDDIFSQSIFVNHGADFQSPNKRGPGHFETQTFGPSRRVFSDPIQEAIHSGYSNHHFSTVANHPPEHRYRKRITSHLDFPADPRKYSQSSVSSISVQCPSPQSSSHTDFIYDNVTEQFYDEAFSNSAEVIPNYEVAPVQPEEFGTYDDVANYNTAPSRRMRNDVNRSLSYSRNKKFHSVRNGRIKYNDVDITNLNSGTVLEMQRTKDDSFKRTEKQMLRTISSMINGSLSRRSPGMAEVRRMTTDLGIELSDEEWDEVGRRASSISVGSPDVPTPTGSVIIANKPEKKPNRCRCRCRWTMSFLTVFAIALFIFIFISYFYVGITNDNELALRFDSASDFQARSEIVTQAAINTPG